MTIKELASNYLISYYEGEDEIENLDLVTLPLSSFEGEGLVEEEVRQIQNCQAILKRLSSGLYKQTQLQFKE
jgi:hypothetical protein